MAVHDHLRSLAKDEVGPEGEGFVDATFDAQSRTFVAQCLSRMTARETACFTAAKNVADVEACAPETDRRPEYERPSVAECDALVAHYEKLLRAPNAGAEKEEMVQSILRRTRTGCARHTLRSEVRCQLGALTIEELAPCENQTR